MSDHDSSLRREVCYPDEELLALVMVSVRKERSLDRDMHPPLGLFDDFGRLIIGQVPARVEVGFDRSLVRRDLCGFPFPEQFNGVLSDKLVWSTKSAWTMQRTTRFSELRFSSADCPESHRGPPSRRAQMWAIREFRAGGLNSLR